MTQITEKEHAGNCENETCIDGIPSMPPVTPEEFSRDIAEMLAAPVQMPEPQAEIEVRSMKTYLDLSIHEWRDTLPDGTYKVYTEQQVHQLLAAQAQRVSLSDEAIKELIANTFVSVSPMDGLAIARAVEAAHGIK